jgi:hypothetical protein
MSVELYEHLKTAGMPSEPAHALAMLLVTKADIVPLTTKADLHELRAGTKTDLHELRAEMHREFAAQTRAMITLMIALTAIYAGIVALLR